MRECERQREKEFVAFNLNFNSAMQYGNGNGNRVRKSEDFCISNLSHTFQQNSEPTDR